MRSKKWLTILTAVCSVLGILGIIGFNSVQHKFAYDISLATFGSSLLGFLMSLTEYFVERRKAMESFWLEGVSAVSQLRKAKWIDISEPKEMILNCIHEEQENSRFAGFTDDFLQRMGREKSNKAKNQFIAWLKENEKNVPQSDKEQYIFWETLYMERIENNKEKINLAIDNYIDISTISLASLDNAYGNLDFLFANKRLRADAYNKIYNRIRTMRDSFVTEAFHFSLLKKHQGNFAVCARKAMELNDLLFAEKEEVYKGIEMHFIYEKACDEIDEALDLFRSQIYKGSKPEKNVYLPRSGQYTKLNEETQIVVRKE